MSAAFHWSPWSSASGRPPTTRSLMYRTAYSSAPCAAPTHMAAFPHRSWLRCEISVLNASLFDGSPSRSTSSGPTYTSSKASSASLVPRRPIFTCVPAQVTPSDCRSTTTAPMPFDPSLPGKRHHTRHAPALCPPVT